MFNAEYLADPHAHNARLREAAPSHRIALPDGSAARLVCPYELVRAGLADPELSLDKKRSRGGYAGFSLPPALDANLLNMDPPQHTRIRRLVTKAFTVRRVQELRPRVAEHAESLADKLISPSDLIAEYATPIPSVALGALLGVSASDQDAFSALIGRMLVPEHPRQLPATIAEITTFLADLVAARTRSPGEDLLSELTTSELSRDELVSLAFLLLGAGVENVQNTIGTGIFLLLSHPRQLTDLRAEPGLLRGAVEEILRHDPVSPLAIRRFALSDSEHWEAGETVMLSLAAANRDPARFPDPDHFDVRRTDNAHVTFGHGVHHCVGAALARMEVEVAISALLRRFPSLTLAVPVEELSWRTSFRSRSLSALPVLLE
ncbi:cytochrome P450 [Allokutzneria sp. NRRL B-24872]|uniref:cytochrome P450 family protein n=1 Tax=Allokutzneria sp. NRRL B-24872 TaxID=1137961 RepID=UPI001AEF62C0|nr:cytochrome P450 [Allokutzneria sp. NRRL B-24872]